MNRIVTWTAWGAAALSAAIVAAGAAAQDAAHPPAWAFPSIRRGPPPSQAPDKTLPGSALTVSEARLLSSTDIVDWYPQQHPPMPPAVRSAQAPKMACGYCHLPSGAGRPENEAVAGLDRAYFIRQIEDIRKGDRTFPSVGPTGIMRQLALAATPAEVESVADYFANLPYISHVRVVEAAQIPKATSEGFVFHFASDGQVEPVGHRIVEGPEKFEDFELRNPATRYIAYVPPGSAARGAALAAGGEGRPACATCHGDGLKGSDIAPPLAGRFPTAMFRQLWSFKTGLRTGDDAAPMKPEVAGLSEDDMIALAAYAATLTP